MFQHYDDILSRIAEPPSWFDEQGVPRYCDFAPNRIANIYAHECALLEIACQDCGQIFFVALDEKGANEAIAMPGRNSPWQKLAELIRSHMIEYSDPPNVDCCGAGPSMTSITRRVLEYWHRWQDTYTEPGSPAVLVRASSMDWQRDRSLEIEIPQTGG
jgi:hypothetical protein